MSDEPIDKLLTMMQEMTAAIRTLVANQEKLALEQQHAAKALGEGGTLLRNHGGDVSNSKKRR